MLELLAFLHKERVQLPDDVYEAAIHCALLEFAADGDLGQGIHPIVVYVTAQWLPASAAY